MRNLHTGELVQVFRQGNGVVILGPDGKGDMLQFDADTPVNAYPIDVGPIEDQYP